MMLADSKRAIVGSINLAPGSFDSRRELAIETDHHHAVKRLEETAHARLGGVAQDRPQRRRSARDLKKRDLGYKPTRIGRTRRTQEAQTQRLNRGGRAVRREPARAVRCDYLGRIARPRDDRDNRRRYRSTLLHPTPSGRCTRSMRTTAALRPPTRSTMALAASSGRCATCRVSARHVSRDRTRRSSTNCSRAIAPGSPQKASLHPVRT